MIPHDDPSIGVLRTPPSSLEAESCVLGGLLLDNSAWDRVSDLLTDGDFYRFEHREIYGAIGAMVNALKPADVFTVADRLAGLGKEVGGIDYLNALAQFVPSAANIRRYAEMVREKSILRKLITASDEIATSAFNTAGKPISEIADDAEKRISTSSKAGRMPAMNGSPWTNSSCRSSTTCRSARTATTRGIRATSPRA